MSKTTNKVINSILMCFFVLTISTSCSTGDDYQLKTVKGDPLNTHIYELDNGLKVYLTVNELEPRIQTAIAVRTGGKHDPPDDTGLSHYLEHLMFKGTDRFGTLDWEKEKGYLEKIDSLYEVHRSLTDEKEREAIYRIIDSVSYEASKYAIPNEYDRMMGSMGARGTNAFTGVEQTVYINDIPSNQIERWLTIEAERFRNPIFRLFHTELEVVYEEKNMSLDRDGSKANEALMRALYPHHTYGTQTILGSQEHLKDPSLKNIREYYYERYVPNNMAIIMSGDFDPKEVIRQINELFGHFEPGELEEYDWEDETPITEPIEVEVLGPDSEFIRLGFRFPGSGTKEADLLAITNKVLFNRTAGLIDLNLNQAQKVLGSNSSTYVKDDYSTHFFFGRPKQDQSLEEVRDLLLEQIELVKNGDFPEWLIEAAVNDLKLTEVRRIESNRGRFGMLLNSFIHDIPWEYVLETFDRYEQITKQDIVDFANEYYGNNYAVVYKRTGTDDSVVEVEKPHITPVVLNRDAKSDFYEDVMSMEAEPIEPVFIDYEKDIITKKLNDHIPVYYKENTVSDIFTLYYLFDMGSNHDRKLGMAINYLEYLGTGEFTPEQLRQKFYKTGCSFNVFSSDDQVYVYLTGLTDNMEQGLKLFESLLADAQPNEQALENLKRDVLRQRENRKLNKNVILWSGMYNYGIYGSHNPFTNILSEDELLAVTSKELIERIKNLNSYPHRVLYHGTHQPEVLAELLKEHHRYPERPMALPGEKVFPKLDSRRTQVFVVDYDMTQVEIMMLARTTQYEEEKIPVINMFNSYFGSGMSSIVFQELREAKGLAYSAFAGYTTPSRPDRSHFVRTYIATQNDKLPEALEGMNSLLNDMPHSANSFQASKETILERIRSARVTGTSVLFNYENARKMGRDHDIRKDIFNQVQYMTFDDLAQFQQEYVLDNKYNILVLGKTEDIDKEALGKYGRINYLTLEDIFGY